MQTLTVEKRSQALKNVQLRKEGKIPAVFYGPKQESTSVVLSFSEFIKVWKKAGESSIIVLKDGASEHEALIHDIDLDPVTSKPRHVDFYVIEKGKKLQIDIPLIFEGISPAVKDKGGILVKVVHEIKIEALPKDLPHDLHVDISTLIELDSTITAAQITLPAGVTLVDSASEVIASISVAKDEPIEAPTVLDMSAIEVEKKGKEAKEGEAGAEGTDAKDAGKEGKK